MPLNMSCSLEAYRANVKELIESGKKPNQAVAIAIRQLKKVCGVDGEKRMTPTQIIGESTVTLRMIDIVADLKNYAKRLDCRFDNFDDVLNRFEDFRVMLKPTKSDWSVINNFKKQNESAGSKDHRGYWLSVSKQCGTVSECLRIYGLVLEHEIPGADDVFQRRAIQLANESKWLGFDEI